MSSDIEQHAKLLSDEELVDVCFNRVSDYIPELHRLYMNELKSRGDERYFRERYSHLINSVNDNNPKDKTEMNFWNDPVVVMILLFITYVICLLAYDIFTVYPYIEVLDVLLEIDPLGEVWKFTKIIPDILLVIAAYLLIFKRDYRAPIYTILFLKVSLIVTVIDAVVVFLTISSHTPVVHVYVAMTLRYLFSITIIALWILYFRFSADVRKSFSVTSDELSFLNYLDWRNSLKQKLGR